MGRSNAILHNNIFHDIGINIMTEQNSQYTNQYGFVKTNVIDVFPEGTEFRFGGMLVIKNGELNQKGLWFKCEKLSTIKKKPKAVVVDESLKKEVEANKEIVSKLDNYIAKEEGF